MTSVELEQDNEPRFSYGRIWLLGAGFLGVMLAFTLYNSFVPLMYEEFLSSRTQIGLLMGTDNLVGLILIPIIGAWSDRVNGGRLGRRLPFILVAVPVAAVTFAGIPWAASALWGLIIIEVLFTAAMHTYRGPVISLMPDHTPPAKRSTGNGIINLMGGIGVLISFAGLSLLYDVDPRLPFGIGAVLLAGTAVIVWFAALRNPPHVANMPAEDAARPLHTTLTGVLRLFERRNHGQLFILGGMLTYFIGYAGLDAMFRLYGVNVLGLTEGQAAFVLTGFAAAFMGASFFAGMLGTKLGEVRTMRIGLAVLPVLFIAAAPLRTVAPVVGLLIIGGLAWSLVNVQALPLVADLGGRDRIGFFVGLYYLFTMVGQMIGPAILGSAMDLFGDSGLFIGGAASFVAGSILLARGQKRLPDTPEVTARRKIA